jgi:C-terminal processing protease CtpA/Prc
VVWVALGTPGDKAGFKKGDIIKTINGTDVDALDGIHTVLTVRKLFKEKIGTHYKVTVSRNGKHLDMQMELRDLYQAP